MCDGPYIAHVHDPGTAPPNLARVQEIAAGMWRIQTAAVIDLRRHRRLWEDFYDTVLVESRANEPRESLESVKRRLKLTKAHG